MKKGDDLTLQLRLILALCSLSDFKDARDVVIPEWYLCYLEAMCLLYIVKATITGLLNKGESYLA